MHCFRPAFFVASKIHNFCDPIGFKHTCVLQAELVEDMNALKLDGGKPGLVIEREECLSVPYVTSNDFHAMVVFEKFKSLIKEIRALYTEEATLNHGETVCAAAPQVMETPQAVEAVLCRYFVNGLCTRGYQCPFSHSVQARRPMCKFFSTLKGCRSGASCFFSHDHSITAPISAPAVYPRGNEAASANSFLRLLPKNGSDCVLVLNDKDLRFTSNLSRHCDPAQIFVTTPYPCSLDLVALSNGSRILWNMSKPFNSIIETKGEVSIPWKEVQSVLWFVETDGSGSSLQRSLMQKFFEFLAIRVLAESIYHLQVIVTVNNIRFAQLQVERLARECFFSLDESFPFDESTFGKLVDPIDVTRPMQVCAPFSYVFTMRPPAVAQYGDYATVLRECLYRNRE